MNPQFHLDQDVGRRLKEQLNLRYADDVARTATDLGLQRASEGHHLIEAAKANRIFVTSNVRDFITIHDAWIRWSAEWGIQRSHAGILIIPQLWGPQKAAYEIASFLNGRTTIPNEIWGYDNDPAMQRWIQNPTR
jgi:hypothetical protein